MNLYLCEVNVARKILQVILAEGRIALSSRAIDSIQKVA